MTEPEVFDIEGIGPVLLARSPRAKRVTITIRPDKRIRVSVPARLSFKAALEFVRQKENWIKKTRSRIRRIRSRQKSLAALFASIDKARAEKTLKTRLYTLAAKNGFHFNRVYIRNQKTRWGSCSHNGDISLNMKAMALAPELRDYVILHELVHTMVHNHSKKFWNELNRYVPNAKAMDARLKEYDLRLM
jgi:predicted metal-dependent hydrolase